MDQPSQLPLTLELCVCTCACIFVGGLCALRLLRAPAGGILTERFLPRDLRMDSKEMDIARREWERIAFMQV